MAEKRKVKWYDTFNPFAHVEASKPKKKDKPKRKTIPVDHEATIREKERAKRGRAAAKRGGYQGTPTDPSMDRPKKTSGKKTSGVKVVKPRKKT